MIPLKFTDFSIDRRRIRIWSVCAKLDQCWRNFPRAFDWTCPRTPDGRPRKILGAMQETKIQLKFYYNKITVSRFSLTNFVSSKDSYFGCKIWRLKSMMPEHTTLYHPSVVNRNLLTMSLRPRLVLVISLHFLAVPSYT